MKFRLQPSSKRGKDHKGVTRRAREHTDLLAEARPGMQPEYFNALWWKHRSGELFRDEARGSWNRLLEDEPASLYAPEDPMTRAEITFDSGAMIYDALFLALVESTETVTADGKLLRALEGTDWARLARSLITVGDLI